MKDLNDTSSHPSQGSDSTDVSSSNSASHAQIDLQEISLTLKSILKKSATKDFYNEANYLEHAQLAVDALKTLFLKTSTAAQSLYGVPAAVSKPLFQKIIKELNHLYEEFEDNGWQCGKHPLGLMPSSPQGLERFIGAISSKSVQSSVTNIHRLSNQLEYLRLHPTSPIESLSQSAQTVIHQLVKKIKSNENIKQLIIENPVIIYQADNEETQSNELGFTPLFYAAKYSSNPKIFRELLFHTPSTLDKKYLITKVLSEINNPLFNTKPIMLCAHYAQDNMLEALLNELTLKEQQKEVTSICKKGAFKGWSALHFACHNFGNRQESRDDAVAKVQRLLGLGADINAVTETHPAQDAFILAIETGKPDLIRLLISHQIQTPILHPELNHIEIIKDSRLSDADKQEFIEYLQSLGCAAQAFAELGAQTSVGNKRKSMATTSDSREELLEHVDNEAKKIQAQQMIQQYAQTRELKLGKAFGEGDCFFDSFSQGLQAIFPDQVPCNVSQLRQICALETQQPNPWLAQELQVEHQSLENYRKEIKFCKDDFQYGSIHEQSTPIWGRPNIEGRLLCQHFQVNLAVTEVCEVDGRLQLLHSNVPDHQEQRPTIHIMVSQHTLHFVPLLPKAHDIPALPRRMSKYKRPESFGASNSSSFFNEELPNPDTDKHTLPQKK